MQKLILYRKLQNKFIFTIIIYMKQLAITIEIPEQLGNKDVAVVGTTQISGDESSFFETIQIVNQYLWFGIWLVCMICLIWGWINLITANWNSEKTKKTSKLLMGSLIWILICVLSYAIVRLVINLFQ